MCPLNTLGNFSEQFGKIKLMCILLKIYHKYKKKLVIANCSIIEIYMHHGSLSLKVNENLDNLPKLIILILHNQNFTR